METKNWWLNVGKKIIETIISVKVLTIAALMATSTKLVLLGFMTGGEWATVNGSIISIVFALREGFKITRVNANNGDSEKINV